MTLSRPLIGSKYKTKRMGIRGLGGFLKWKVPQARRAINWNAHRGQHWAIDCSCLMYRARAENLSPITVMASLLVRCRRAGITAVVIFDGRPPAVKSDTIDQRKIQRVAAQKEMADIKAELKEHGTELTELQRADKEQRCAVLQKKAPQVTHSDKDDLKKFLYAAGVLFVTASGEADDILAYLCRTGEIHAVVSTDMDMLARGVPLLILPETADTSVLTVITTSVVLDGLRLTESQFVDACMLMGSDYSGKGWHSMLPAAAVDAARRGVDWSVIDVSGTVCDTMARGARLLRGEGVSWEIMLGEKQIEKWAAGPPPCEPESIATHAATHGWPLDWVTVLSSV